VLLAWQAARIPLEGPVEASLAHARTWHALEGRLGLAGIENAVISAVYRPDAIDLARWGYSNLHLFAIVAFMLLISTRAPDRYPPLRSAFVLLHLPALVVRALEPREPQVGRKPPAGDERRSECVVGPPYELVSDRDVLQAVMAPVDERAAGAEVLRGQGGECRPSGVGVSLAGHGARASSAAAGMAVADVSRGSSGTRTTPRCTGRIRGSRSRDAR
jgi:hypothetical protein